MIIDRVTNFLKLKTVLCHFCFLIKFSMASFARSTPNPTNHLFNRLEEINSKDVYGVWTLDPMIEHMYGFHFIIYSEIQR